MKDRAYAKINMALDVVSEREDGYHELNSIMVPIGLFDELEIVKAEKMSYECNKKLAFNEKNTIVKAINYMKDTYNITDNFKVVLDKRTPSQAGLGGGSADGASAIRILNKMYHLNMNKEEIEKACLSIGADVVFTYYNKAAVVKGIGENLEFFKIKKSLNVLLVKPKEGVSTKECYETLNIETCDHPEISLIKDALENGKEYRHLLKNSLEEPSLKLCPVISKIKKELENEGLAYPLMSGSGSTVFVLDEDYNKLLKIKDKLRRKYYFVYITKIHI